LHPKGKLIAALAVCSAGCLEAQDVENVLDNTKKALTDPVTISGSIGASSVFYRSFGINPRRDPFYWVVNANLNISILNKVQIPLSAVLTQQDHSFSHGLDKFRQPFNQFGISPSYRWLTVHAGYRSMQFSEYSLSGTIWLGGGVEIKPERSHVSAAAFMGRFLKAVPGGMVAGVAIDASAYERWGGGAKVRFGDKVGFGELSFLKITDKPFSIPFDSVRTITPQDNLVLGAKAQRQFNKLIAGAIELNTSILTKNLYEERYTIQRFTYVNQLVDARPSTQLNKAMKVDIDLTPGTLNTGLHFKRIDPDYRSLGAQFLTNDVEEISASFALPLFKNKMNMNAALGLQKNNLDRKQVLTSRRIIASLNVSHNVNERINVFGSYSSFSSNMIAQRDLYTDSIRLVQISQTGNLGSSVSFGRKTRNQVNVSFNYQQAYGSGQQTNTFYSANLGYNLIFGTSGWMASISGLVNRMLLEPATSNDMLGPQAMIKKSLRKDKIRIAITGTMQNSYAGARILSRTYSANGLIQLSLHPSHNLRAEFSILRREGTSARVIGFTEHRLSISYNYTIKGSIKELYKTK
jgi:hypothetical protein